MTTQLEFWQSTGLGFIDTGISRRSGDFLPISSAAAGLVKTSVEQDEVTDSMGRDLVFGSRCSGSFATFDGDGAFWKTSQRCLFGGLIPFSDRWPRAGSIVNGTAYRHRPLARLTGEIAFGLLPTPTASDAIKRGRVTPRQGAMGLSETVGGQLNPTWVEWLMGFPLGWTDLEDSETPSSRRSLSGLDGE